MAKMKELLLDGKEIWGVDANGERLFDMVAENDLSLKEYLDKYEAFASNDERNCVFRFFTDTSKKRDALMKELNEAYGKDFCKASKGRYMLSHGIVFDNMPKDLAIGRKYS